MPEKDDAATKKCREAVNKLHEVMKSLDLAHLNVQHGERRYSTAITLFSLWIGFAIADFVAAATVVYSVGPITGMEPIYAFYNPGGAEFMNFTWFGLALIISVVFALVSLCYTLTCSVSLRSARNRLRETHQELKNAKSCIIEVCPIELWYSGEA